MHTLIIQVRKVEQGVKKGGKKVHMDDFVAY